MSFDDKVRLVVSRETMLKQNPVYKSVFNICRGKAHKAPPIDKKHTMLLNIVSQPLEGYFLCGTSQAENFKLLKKHCYAGWSAASNRPKVWTVIV